MGRLDGRSIKAGGALGMATRHSEWAVAMARSTSQTQFHSSIGSFLKRPTAPIRMRTSEREFHRPGIPLDTHLGTIP